MVIEIASKTGLIGYLDSSKIYLVATDEDDDEVYCNIYIGNACYRIYTQQGGYVKIDGVKLTMPADIVEELHKIMPNRV